MISQILKYRNTAQSPDSAGTTYTVVRAVRTTDSLFRFLNLPLQIKNFLIKNSMVTGDLENIQH